MKCSCRILWLVIFISAGVLSAKALPAPGVAAHTDPLNLDPAVRAAYDRFYNLDYDGSLRMFEAIAAAHPTEPIAWDYVLVDTVFRELYSQDLLDTTYYAHDSFLLTKRDVPVPAATRRQIDDLTQRVVSLADARLHANPNDKNALFARSYAHGLHGAFVLLVDHSYRAAAHEGLEARSDSEAVLKIDPDYADAKLAIGIQQFSIASLPRFLRFVVGIMGVSGSKEKGLDMLRDAATRGVVTSVEARTALSLFLRHDKRYNEALAVERSLVSQYPHDFLFRLEEANILKDEGTGPVAMASYQAVLNDATKKGYFIDPRLQLTWFGLADTQRGWGRIKESAYGYTQAASQPNCSDWLRKRAELNAGESFDLLHDRSQAVHWYQLAAAPGGDQSQADTAQRYLDKPYTGK